MRILVPIRRMSPGWHFREVAGDESRVRNTFRCGTPTLGGRGRGRGHLLIHAECWPFLAGPASPTTPALQSRAQLWRSEEHTSELQSLMRISYAVFCLKTKTKHTLTYKHALQPH